jgi:succinate-acetate transporter protein
MWFFLSVPIIFIVLGLLIWLLAANPTVKECGRLTVQAGLIGLCFSLSSHYFPLRR